MTDTSRSQHEELRERSRRVWSTGDYSFASRHLEPAADALVERLGIGPGHHVLDVAAGHGNCAIAAAQAGANVIATDFSPHMIEGGSARTKAAELDVQWQLADAAALPFPDSTFDYVTSTFGAIFSLEPEQTAAEAVRVIRPGGVAAWTAWVNDGVTSKTQAIARRYSNTPPLGTADPFAWGDQHVAAKRFAALGCDLEVVPRHLTLRFASWDAWRSEAQSHGVAVVARSLMPPEAFAAMHDETQAVLAEHARETAAGIEFDSAYVELIARKG